MPKREDINKVLIIGSGPIIIGQACEFDYSGTQACKALKAQGYEIVLVNSNPATIMTDPGMADKTYIEPLTIDTIEKIIEIEKPDALLPNLGGQTALNLTSDLHNQGILEKHNVEVIGVTVDAIERGEDRAAFKETMNKLNIPLPISEISTSVEQAEKIAAEIGYPVVLRPAYTMGGTGGGIAYNIEELRTIVTRGLAASIVNQVLVEEGVVGWEELELEVVRDKKNQKITVCFIENIDPMGVHTGDSFCTAPMFTVSQELQKRMQDISYKIVDAIGVIGGTNVQLAHNRENGRLVVIEINPRTSRSSALASKATGFPIALISTKLAAGLTMDEIPYWKEGTLEKYKPSGDYVVIKFARWAFEKFPQAKDVLGTQMKAVGEVMSIGKTFKEAFQKSIRSLEIKRHGLGWTKDFNTLSLETLMQKVSIPSSERYFQIYEAFRKEATIEEMFKVTNITKQFLIEIKELVDFEQEILSSSWENLSNEKLEQAKEFGFADKYLAKIFNVQESIVRKKRIEIGKISRYEAVPVSGVEDAAYYYSTYSKGKDEVPVSKNKKIMILGGGPNRIGQGIEFDYTCVHTALTLRDAGYETIMINCNPETVSTDYDTSNKLYFEPLTVEDVLTIYEKEKPEGVIVQFGGQTPLNIAQELKDNGVNILGTSPESIQFAEDRERFREKMIELNIPQPESGTARSLEQAIEIANQIGYPLMVRPSFVLGGRGMEIIYDEGMLKKYTKEAIKENPDHPILIDRFLESAIETEVDALSDGKDTFVASIMEHIELAGVHSGDSACAIPSKNIKKEHLDIIEKYTAQIAEALNVVGLMNIQYAICDDTVYILEANPRASRTVPIVSKITSVPIAKVATLLTIGKKIKDFPELKKYDIPYTGVKEAVFPFNMFHSVDPLLGPEMRATGEVMGMADSFGLAFFKAQKAAKSALPLKGNALLTVTDKDKEDLIPIAKKLIKIGFKIYSTENTSKFLTKNDISNTLINKLHEGRPNIADAIKNGEINLIINTPIGKSSKYDDSYIRIMAIGHKIPYITSIAAAKASVEGIEEANKNTIIPKSLQEYHTEIK
jgi:carbamoyl-phosphate synthase large subunit